MMGNHLLMVVTASLLIEWNGYIHPLASSALFNNYLSVRDPLLL
jgi:hypothetical protein